MAFTTEMGMEIIKSSFGNRRINEGVLVRQECY
jgi:hypothetical protein